MFSSIFHLISRLIWIALLILIIIFLMNNSQIIAINLYPLPFIAETKTFIVMFIFFVFGMIFGILTCSKTIIRKSIENFGSRRKIKKLEKQIHHEDN